MNRVTQKEILQAADIEQRTIELCGTLWDKKGDWSIGTTWDAERQIWEATFSSPLIHCEAPLEHTKFSIFKLYALCALFDWLKDNPPEVLKRKYE